MGTTKGSDPVKAVWAKREGKEVHVNDADGVKEEVRNLFQTIFDSRGGSIDEGDSYKEVLTKMDEKIREGYKSNMSTYGQTRMEMMVRDPSPRKKPGNI